MTALTSILVRDHAVPVRKIEEALERQVVSGGDLETALLELDVIAEDVLSAYRAATFGLLPATRDEVMGAAAEVVHLVPRDVAEREGIVPLRVERRILVAAAASPPSPERDQQLGFFLGYDLVYRIVSPARLALALGAHYGTEVAPRLVRLGERLARRDPGVAAYVAPPTSTSPAGSVAPTPLERDPRSLPAPPPAASTTPAPRDSASLFLRPEGQEPTVVDHAAPALQPTVPGRAHSAAPGPGPPAQPDRRASQATVSGVTPAPTTRLSARGLGVRGAPDSAEDSPDAVASPPIAPDAGSPSASADSPSTPDVAIRGPSDGPADRTRPTYERLDRRRGPLGYEEAVDLLQDAAHRDEVLAVLFTYARQFFDYVALFVIAEGCLVGRDAKGPGASAQAVAGARVEPAPGSTLAAVVASGAPACVDLDVQPRDRSLVQLLGRTARQPAALVPATVRRRSVVLVYGDQGGDPMVLPDLGRLLALLPRVSEAFERVIIRRKHEGASMRPPGPPPDVFEADAEPPASPGPSSLRPPPAPVSPAPPSHTPFEGRSPIASAVARLGAADTEPAPPPRMSPLPPHESGGASTSRRAPVSEPPANVDPRPTQQPGPFPETRGPLEETASYATRPSVPPTGRPSRAERPSVTTGDTRRLPAVPGPGEPSVIVDMGSRVDGLAERLLTSGPEDADLAVEPLLRLGEAALPVLIRHFPGPLWFQRDQPHRRLPRGRDVSAVARALVAFGGASVPYLATSLGDARADVRFYALLVASDLVDRRIPRLVAPRLLDDDEGVRRLALRVLGHYRRFPDALGAALHAVRSEARAPRRGRAGEATDARRLLAVEALGDLRDGESLDVLIGLLEDPTTGPTAHRALVALTKQDFGASPSRWRSWREKQGGRHRIEWLIDALMHDDEDRRAQASEELQHLTQQYLGYHPKLPLRDRKVAQEKYRAWWEREGRAAWAT